MADWDQAQWAQWVASIDPTAPPPEDVTACATFFHSLQFLQTSVQLDSVDPLELLAAPGAPEAGAIGQKALVRRA
eukprot:294182-Pyramimonas_sp.AAC.1